MKKILYIIALCVVFSACNSGKRKWVDISEVVSQLASSPVPADYIVKSFENHEAVLLGGSDTVNANFDFLAGIVPQLYASNIYNIALKTGAEEDQARLDSVLTAPEYDEAAIHEMTDAFKPNPAVMNIYKAVWELNHNLSPDKPQFHIVNLGYRYNYDALKEGKAGSPQVDDKMYYRGNPSKFAASIIKHYIGLGIKVLCFVDVNDALTHYHFSTPFEMYGNDSDVVNITMGEKLHEVNGNRVATVLIHGALRGANGGTVPVACGDIDEAIMQNGGKAVGFDLFDGVSPTPAGHLNDTSWYATGYTDFMLADLAQGYIYLPK